MLEVNKEFECKVLMPWMLYMVSKQRLRIWTRDSLDAIYIVGKLWLWIGTPTAMPKELFLQFATSDQNKCRLPICDYVSVIYRSLKMLGMVLISFRSYIPFFISIDLFYPFFPNCSKVSSVSSKICLHFFNLPNS
jgi:hypothetical protein